MDHPTPDVLALVALGEDVEPAVLEHVSVCTSCFGEIDALQQVVVLGRSLGPDDRLVAPHPRVWQNVAQAVAGGQVIPLPGAAARAQDPVPTSAGPDPRTGAAGRPRGRRRWGLTALAAAVALVVGLGGGFAIKTLLNPGSSVVSSAQLNALPQFPGANGTATLEKGPGGQRFLAITMEMPPDLHPKGTLEVWMSDTRAEDMVAMGTMSGLSARFPVPANVDLASHPIVDVSLEPAGDTEPAHSQVSVLRGRLPS